MVILFVFIIYYGYFFVYILYDVQKTILVV